MKPISTVQLIAYCKPVPPLPGDATDRQRRQHLRLIIHNSSGLASWSDFELKKRRNGSPKDQYYLAFRDVRQQALEAEEASIRALRSKTLRNVKNLKDAEVKYDTLTLSARYAFLLSDPKLESRFSAAL